MTRLTPTSTPRIALALAALAAAGCSQWSFEIIPESHYQAEVRDLALDSYDEGVRFVEAGNHEIALNRFERSTAISPRPAAWYQLGRTHDHLGDGESAAVFYMLALGAAPDFQEARFALARLGFDPPEEETMKGDPGVWAAFAAVVEEEVRVRRAMRETEMAGLTEEERRALRERMLARIDLATRRRKPTLEEVRSVLFGQPVDLETIPRAGGSPDRQIVLNTYPYHFANGQRFQRDKEYEKAVSEYRTALEIEPDSLDARLNLGDCYLNLERYVLAQQQYVTAAGEHPDSARPLLKMGNYFERLERTDLARDYYKQSMAKDPEYLEAYNNLAALEIRERNYAGAVDYLRSLLLIDPDYSLGWLNLGVAYENSGDPARAIDAYRRYVELAGPRSAEVQVWIQDLVEEAGSL